MNAGRPTFSVCIPAYNRAHHLSSLLDSIFAQDFDDFNIVICEDDSPQRHEIAEIVRQYAEAHPGVISYYENEVNLGYDGNIRNLVAKATGEFCFFMGNDDLMCAGALAHVADVIRRNPDVGFVLKSYAWFTHTLADVSDGVRYFKEEHRFAAGREAVLFCYRRSGVISGYVVRRDPAHAVATERYDGTLYYQMHLTAQVLASWPAVFTPQVLILCRNSEPPDFGNSAKEKGKFVPGGYTPQARLNMVQGVLAIVRDFEAGSGIQVAESVQRDYANYFYVYIQDQLNLPVRDYFALYRGYGRMGFSRYPMFHLYFVVAYLLGQKKFDAVTARIRLLLGGRSPRFGAVAK